jgi:murein DD-endopeptidase MepM/ murein hydrolase activator NlpD
MLEERIRFIYLSKNGTGIKQISLTWKKFCIVLFAITILLIGGIASSIGLFTRLYQNYRIASLESDRGNLQKELLTIKERVVSLSSRLAEIELTGDDLRDVANLPPIDSDTRQVGVGGPSYRAALDFGYAPDSIDRTSGEIRFDLDKLERAVFLEKSSMIEIAKRLRDRERYLNHFPSIKPVPDGPIISEFGYRIDPFTHKNTMHYGLDFAALLGTNILAAADGVVTVAEKMYTPHKGYGMEIVIDHGNGYKTRYAHCSDILVRKGDRVKRWDTIGKVGKTGKAQGYHLHYEVIYNNKHEDPVNYLYN